VLPNLCAAAHKCAARAVEVCCGRMSEIKSFNEKFQWEVWFPKFSHGTLLPPHHNIRIWSLNIVVMWLYLTICFGCLCMVTVLVRWTVMTFFFPDHGPLSMPTSSFMPLLTLSQILHAIFWAFLNFIWFQRQVPNVNVGLYGKNLVREQFCYKLDFFGLHTAKKLQLIKCAACRNWDLS